jgi:hypothetical protein
VNTIRGMLAVDELGNDRHALADALRAWRWVCVKRYGVHSVFGAARRHARIMGNDPGALF